MNKELQDLAWASLPKESRDQIREYQMFSSISGHTKELLDLVFGYDNIISDSEPEEMLHVSRRMLIDRYAKFRRIANDPNTIDRESFIVRLQELSYLFGNKCLPDQKPFGEWLDKMHTIVDKTIEAVDQQSSVPLLVFR